ncbi:MAG TPA: DUF559 domain-containing protein [Alphaproteobacteria bacterium]|nr:DUF559 domain-containing protein [Alphaproteobacteria bacterium]
MRLNEHGNTALDYRRARELRNNASPFEKKLWAVLRTEATAHGLKFRRQVALHPFIADFACLEARLLVELDGDSHDARQEYDRKRDSDLQQREFSVLRFSNEDVKKNVEGVVEMILATADRLVREREQQSLLMAPLPRIKSGAGSNPPHEGEGIQPAYTERKG